MPHEQNITIDSTMAELDELSLEDEVVIRARGTVKELMAGRTLDFIGEGQEERIPPSMHLKLTDIRVRKANPFADLDDDEND